MSARHNNLQRQNQVLVGLQELVADMIAELDLQVILQKAVERTAELVGADIVTIHIYDLLKGTVHAAAGYGLLDTDTFHQHRPGRGKAVMLVAGRGQPIIAEDVSASELAGPFVSREGVRSAAGFPLKVRDKVIGVLFVSFREPHQFDTEEVDILVSFGNLAAVAMHAARSYEQAQARAQTIRQLSEVTQSLAILQESPEVLEETLERVATTAMEILEADTVDLYQYRADVDDFVLPPIMVGERKFPRLVPRQILSDDVVAKIVHTGQKLFASDAQEHPVLVGDWELPREDLPGQRFVLRERIVSSAAVPMKVGEEVLGVMFASYRQRRDFDADVELRDRIEIVANQAGIAIQNARLFGNAQRRIRDLGIVNEVVQTISTKLDTQGLLETIVSQVADRLNCTHCTIFFPKKEGGELLLVPRVTHGVRSAEIMTRRFKPSEGLAGWVFQKGESLVLADARKDSRFSPAREGRDQPRSMLIAPVKVGDQTIGVLSADQDEYGWFSEGDRRLVDSLAQQAGIAIQRATALDLMQDIANRIISSKKVGEILQQVVSGAIKLTNTTSGVIYLLNDDKTSIVRSYIHPPGFDHPSPRLDKGEGLTHDVVDTGEVLVIHDIRRDIRVSPVLYDRGVRSMIAVPLHLDREVVGVLYLNDEDVHYFTDTEITLLSTLANQAVAAIQGVERRVEDISAIADINRAIIQESLGKVTQLIVERAVMLTQADYSVLRLVDSSGKYLTVEASFGRETRKDPLLIDERSFTGWVALRKAAELCSNVSQAEHYLGWHEDIKSCMAAPLMYQEELVGTLYVESTTGDAFSEHYQLELLEALANQSALAIENARLFQELEARAEQLQGLQEVAATISTVPSEPDRVLRLIVDNLANVFPKASCAIRHYDPEQDEFGGWVAAGPLEKWGESPRSEGTSRYVVGEMAPLFYEDTSIEPPEGQPAVRDRFVKQGVKAAAHLPLISRRGVIGVLYLDLMVPHRFSGQERSILEVFATQAAIAMENARLYARLERQVRELKVLTEIGRTVSNLGIDEILYLVYEQMGEIMDLSDAQVQFAFYDESKDEVTFPLAVEQDGGEVIDVVRWSKREDPYREEREDETVNEFRPRVRRDPPGLTEYVIRTEMPVLLVEDFKEKAAERGIKVWPTFGRLDRPTQSWLGVPMVVGGRVTGIISIQSLEVEHAFDEGHLRLLTTVANQAAVAIENARLLDSETRRAQQLAGLQEIGVTITSQLGLQEVLGLIAENANAIMSADFTTLFPYSADESKFERGIRKGRIEVEPSTPSSSGLAARIAKGQEAIFAEDAEKQPALKSTFISNKRIKSFAGVPLVFRGRTVGVLYVNFFKPQRFTEEEYEARLSIGEPSGGGN